jgi:hypothetical protein
MHSRNNVRTRLGLVGEHSSPIPHYFFRPDEVGLSQGVSTVKLIDIAVAESYAVRPPAAEYMEKIRNRAKDLLDQWAKRSAYVQLTYRPADIRIVGKLISLEGGDYLFRFSSGINTRILLLTYDDICVETQYLDILCVFLRNLAGDELSLSLVGKPEPTSEEFDTVYEKLREWVRSGALLTVHFGDDLRSTAMTCKVSESNCAIFSFRGVNMDLAHALDPSQAGSFRIEHFLHWTQITAYTGNTHQFFSVADGDLMEDIIAKGNYQEGKNALQWCVEAARFK